MHVLIINNVKKIQCLGVREMFTLLGIYLSLPPHTPLPHLPSHILALLYLISQGFMDWTVKNNHPPKVYACIDPSVNLLGENWS